MARGDSGFESLGAIWRERVGLGSGEVSRALLASVPLVVYLEDEAGRLLWANPSFERAIGLEGGGAVGADVSEWILEEDAPAFADFRRHARAGAKASIDVRGRAVDGREVGLRLTGLRVEGAAKETFVFAGEDVSAVRLAESARQRAEASYRELVETASDLVWEVDAEGRWTFLNAASWSVYGAVPADLIGRPASGRVPPGVEAPDPIGLALSGKAVSDMETRHVDVGGREKHLSFTGKPRRDPDGRVVGARGTARDVTARVKARHVSRDLERHLSLLRSLINNTPDLIFYKDSEGIYRGCNRAFEAFVGMGEDELVGKTDHDLFPADRAAEFKASDRRVLDSGEPEKFEEWVTYPDGRRVLLDTRKMPFFGADGDFLGLIGISRDLTDRALIESRLKEMAEEAERATRMKSAFLANMSHEIRTPMNGVLGMTELLLTTELDEHQRSSAEMILSSAETLLRILDDILDFSKIEAGQLMLEETPYDLWVAIDGAARVLVIRAAERATELIIDVAEDVPRWVLGDPVRLRQVVTNLASNAVKFTEGGEVVVRAEVAKSDPLRPEIRVAIRDTGIGIPADKLAAVFGEFQQADSSTTRHYGGTGLGLAISRRIVELMGGRLEVDSEVGQGSTFSFTVPLAVTEAPEGHEAGPPDIEGVAGARALVVDDHALNRRIIRGFLESAGMEVHEAESAESALDELYTTGDDYALAIIDFLMPGVDGFGLAERIREDEELGSLPVVMLTSAVRPSDAARAQAMGVSYLTKPVDREHFLRTVARTLDAPQPVPVRQVMEEGAAAVGPLRILLAEDNKVNQMVAGSMFEKQGHDVRVVENGIQALDAVAREDFAVVLMDVQMPEMDGIEATRRIRQLPDKAGLPIIALTAHALESERKRCKDAGMDGFVSKPFKPDELYRAIAKAVEEPTTDGGEPQR